MSQFIAVDIETKDKEGFKGSALDFTRAEIIALAFWSNKEKGVLIDQDQMRAWLKDHHDAALVFHNGKFDTKVIGRALGVRVNIAWDTMLAESILPDRPEKLDLETCVAKELGYPKWKDKHLYSSMGTADIDSVKELSLLDVENTYRLFVAQYQKLADLGLLKYFIENNLGLKSLNFLREMEERGLGFNYEKMQEMWRDNLEENKRLCEKLYAGYADTVSEYEAILLAKHPLKPPAPNAKPKTKELYEERLRARKEKYRFNFGSDQQLAWLLKDKLGFPCINLDGKVSTSKDVIELYRGQHPIINDILALKHNQHDASSFFANWDYYHRDGRLHPSYKMDVAKTYRLSCVEPALQQVKRDSGMRALFQAKPGYKLLVMDYSQIEPRLIAHYSADPVLMGIFTHGLDLYEVVARKVLGYQGTNFDLKTKDKQTRDVAKEIALSSFYGIGPDKFAYRLRLKTGVVATPAKAKAYLKGYFEMLTGVLDFKKQLSEQLERDPVVVNPLGRTIYFKSHEFYHLAFNKLIQCTGSDINLFSQVDIDTCFKAAGMQARCVHLVHDEAIYEYPEEEEDKVFSIVQYYAADRYSQAPFNLKVPIKIEMKSGLDWSCK